MNKQEEQTDTRIEMFRMKSGELVITELDVKGAGKDRYYEFITPAEVLVERGTNGVLIFMLRPWLPFELLASTRIVLNPKESGGILEASPELKGFYKSWSNIQVDKQHTFGKIFSEQVTEIEKYEAKKYETSKDLQLKMNASNPVSAHDEFSNAMIQYFESQDSWGGSSATH